MLQRITQRISKVLNPVGDDGRLPLRASGDVKHLPGETGLPIIGNTHRFLLAPFESKRRLHRRYGDAFYTHMFGSYGVSLVGPEAAREVLIDKAQNLSSQYGWELLLGDLFGGGLMLRDFNEHHVHRRIMNVAFRRDPMRGYMSILNPHLREGISGWLARGQLKLYPAIKALTLSSAARVFLGLELESQAEAINDAFIDMLNAAIAIVRVPIPGNRTWRAQRGKAFLERFFYELIPERRSAPGDDMLTHFAHATTDEGETYADADIVPHMIFMLMAAHDTTTAALTNMCFELARAPEWQERLRAQIRELPSQDAVDFDALDTLTDVELVMKEALRLYPPVPSIPRRVVEPCTLGGVHLARNTNIWINVDINHRLGRYWRDPDRFDPDRFGPERAEQSQHRYLWIPFGGGAHRCIGMRFAELNIKTFMVHLLSRARLRLPDDYTPAINHLPFPRPTRGLPMIIEPLSA